MTGGPPKSRGPGIICLGGMPHFRTNPYHLVKIIDPIEYPRFTIINDSWFLHVSTAFLLAKSSIVPIMVTPNLVISILLLLNLIGYPLALVKSSLNRVFFP